MNDITIYTDGACSGNPGVGGWAAILSSGSFKREIFGAEENTTNNRMELRAVIEGLARVKTKHSNITVYSDSAYVVTNINDGWLPKWKANGFKRADNSPLKNVDLWQELMAYLALHCVTFVKVKGHSDNEYNNRCDQLAVGAYKQLLVEHPELAVVKDDTIE